MYVLQSDEVIEPKEHPILEQCSFLGHYKNRGSFKFVLLKTVLSKKSLFKKSAVQGSKCYIGT